MRVAFVQLCRFGDICTVLPLMRERHLQGDDVHCVVHPDFASIMEGVSYVNPILHNTTHRDIAGAIARVKGFDDVIVTQITGNPKARDFPNFMRAQWGQDAVWINDLPLVFDRRDATREAQAKCKYLPLDDGRPLLAYSLNGVSSPFYRSAEFEAWMTANVTAYRLLNIGTLKLDRPYDLLAFLEAADVLLTIHTLPLVLSNATKTPTIVLGPDDPWKWAEFKSHWLGRMTHDEVMTDDGRNSLLSLLDRESELCC